MAVTLKALAQPFGAGALIRARHPDVPEAAGEMIDEQTFQVFYRRTAAALRSYVARALGNETHADDIVQESYLRLVRSPPPTDDPQQLRAFLFRIASRLIVDHSRRGRRERGLQDEPIAGVEASSPDPALRLDLGRMGLAYVEGAGHREIAAALGLREGSVRVLLHRTRRKLARLLGRSGQGQTKMQRDVQDDA